jgi:hypothetical protein
MIEVTAMHCSDDLYCEFDCCIIYYYGNNDSE